jgi:hypothetical protein
VFVLFIAHIGEQGRECHRRDRLEEAFNHLRSFLTGSDSGMTAQS